MNPTIGTHYIWDVHHIDRDLISFQSEVERQMSHLNALTGLTLVGQIYKQFDPIGVTGVLLLAESHMSIHTWPEHGYAAIDLFSCTPIDHQKITDAISELYHTKAISLKLIERGKQLLPLEHKMPSAL